MNIALIIIQIILYIVSLIIAIIAFFTTEPIINELRIIISILFLIAAQNVRKSD